MLQRTDTGMSAAPEPAEASEARTEAKAAQPAPPPSVLGDMVASIAYVREKQQYVSGLKAAVESKTLNPTAAVDECDGVLGNVHQQLCLMLTAALAAPLNGRMHAPHPAEFLPQAERARSLARQLGVETEQLHI